MAFPVFRVLSVGGNAVKLADRLTRGPACALGGVELTGLDSPGSVPFGGEQEVTTHKLPGGGRVFHVMGAQERDIGLSGKLFGPRAVAKARTLDVLRKSGKKVRLTWGDFQRTVVVVKFECDYARAGYVMPYSLTCLVVPAPEPARERSFLENLGKQVSDSLGLPALTPTLEAVQGYARQAQAALPLVASISPSAAASLGGLLAQGQNVASGTIAVAEGRLSGAGQVAGAFGSVGQSAARTTQRDAQSTKELALAVLARNRAKAAARSVSGMGGGA